MDETMRSALLTPIYNMVTKSRHAVPRLYMDVDCCEAKRWKRAMEKSCIAALSCLDLLL